MVTCINKINCDIDLNDLHTASRRHTHHIPCFFSCTVYKVFLWPTVSSSTVPQKQSEIKDVIK